jgi:hypothetical protein
MAVVQISKIQVRRGQKNSNSGIPQLSSAEFAWAVDTQELYIGNGSVAEGAPYVGNSKVLTEHDNLLELIESYQWANSDPSITTSVPRSLQSKLDEYVSVADFGAVGDGVSDDTAAFEAAFTALFKNADENYRKVLLVPNGEYRFSRDLEIPAGRLNPLDPTAAIRNVIIKGETQLGAVLNIGVNNIRFTTIAGLGILDFESTNRPANVLLSNLTIKRTTGQVALSGLADSLIESVRFLGDYELGDTVSSLSSEPSVVFWSNDRDGVKVDNVKFKSCKFESVSVGVTCLQTALFDSEVTFDDCDFFVNDTAIYIEGIATQGNNWRIDNCRFEEIARHAFRSTHGRGTAIQRSRFTNTGNGTNTASNPVDYIVYFGEKLGNVVIDCISDRQQSANIVTSFDAAAVAEVYNGDIVKFVGRTHSDIFLSDSFRPVTIFSAFNKFFTINYFLQLGSYSRVGKLTITVGDDLSEVQTTDEFQYASPLAASPGGTIMTNFEFEAVLRDNDNIIRPDAPNDSSLTPDTVVLTYKNPLLTGAEGTLSFDVTYGV